MNALPIQLDYDCCRSLGFFAFIGNIQFDQDGIKGLLTDAEIV